MTTLPDFLNGALDLRAYGAPDVVPRKWDDVDLARELARGGFGGVILTSDIVPTFDRAYLVRKMAPEIRVFGGLVLNEHIGGFNLAAVRVALEMGARRISMPTASAHHQRVLEHAHGGLSVFDAHRELRQDVRSIVRLIANADAILSTGHLSPEEGFALCEFAYHEGVRKLVIEKPGDYSLGTQREMSVFGVVFEWGPGDPPAAIAQAGVNSTVIASGAGGAGCPGPVEAMAALAERLRAEGFSPEDLRHMFVTQPWHLLE